MKKGQDEHPEQEPEASSSGPARPLRLRKTKRGASSRSGAMHRKGNTHGGIHERGNKRINW